MAPKGSRTILCPHVLIAVTAALALLLVAFNYQLVAALKDFASSDYESSASCPSHCPSQPTHGLAPTTVQFREQPILGSLSPSTDEAWERTALTPKGGFLWVEFNETNNAAWGISMFHALHCLKLLRNVIRSSEMMKNVVGPETGHDGISSGGKPQHLRMNPTHVGHCVGYIAQHLMCAADSTIEPPWFQSNDAGQIIDAGVDGEGYQHECRNASLLWETAAKSEKAALKPWRWQLGDTIESVFGS